VAVAKRWAVAGGLVVLYVLALAVSKAFSVSCGDASGCVTLAELREGAALPEALHLYDREGTPLADVAGPSRRSLTHEEIPDFVREAFVAVEDRRFFDHEGVDAFGVVRAAMKNVTSGGIEEGASTIPMQLVRTLWAEPLRDVGRWRRKVIEARTAPRLIRQLGHERVLDLYLNAIYLGNGVYGIGLASEYYFGTTPDSLTVGQVATLVGMTRAPESYDPRAYPERARSVRDVVLRALGQAGIITAEVVETALAEDLQLPAVEPALGARRERTYVTAAVMREMRRVTPDLVSEAGLRIHTTIDPLVQSEGEAALAAQVAAIEEGRYGRFDVERAGNLQSAAVALDPRTGEVLGWVGGRDFDASEFDRVEQGSRQVGSLVKPLLVATALERGYGITKVVSADTVPIETDDGPWLPADHVTEMELPLREALVRSSNRAAAHLGQSLGLGDVAQLAARGGLETIPDLPSSSIGAFGASLLEMTAAYASFGNGGARVRPHLISRIEGRDGEVLWEASAPGDTVAVMSTQTAYVVLDAMRAVVDRGTGYGVRARGYWGPAAGKTGTTNDGRDAWFVGITPGLVAGVWVGFDEPAEIVRGRGGGDLAAPTWGSWMAALQRTPRFVRSAWIPPGGLERVLYDERSGEVADLRCDGQSRVGLQEAWVHAGRYTMRDCRRPGLLQRMWRGVLSFDARPARRRR